MTQSTPIKLAGYTLALVMPLLAPLGIYTHTPWLSAIVVFGLLPILGLAVGEDRSLPQIGLGQAKFLTTYLCFLPRIYALVWMGTLVWASGYAGASDLGTSHLVALIVSVGIGSAVAICTGHELVHRHAKSDILLGRLITALCHFGHMEVEHRHHHATLGDAETGAVAPRGMSVYRFALIDFIQGLRNAWQMEATRCGRRNLPWWNNQVVQNYALAAALTMANFAIWGRTGAILFVCQSFFAVFVFEVITYIHHYGLVRTPDEEVGSHLAWAHHCWITNCLTFNNTFHSDHHLRPRTPYYELHAMYNAPHLPASYFTMFCIALIPPLWRLLMDRRIDALVLAQTECRSERAEWLMADRCR